MSLVVFLGAKCTILKVHHLLCFFAVCNAKWQVNFDVTLDYISHLISECPSLFVAGLHGNGDDTPALSQATSSDAEAIQCYCEFEISFSLFIIFLLFSEGHIGDLFNTIRKRNIFPSCMVKREIFGDVKLCSFSILNFSWEKIYADF